MQTVILAGGLGTRMADFCQGLPKALLPIGPLKAPFIDLLFKKLVEQGIRDVVLSTGFGAAPLEAYVGDGSQWGLRVQISRDPAYRPLGTGGALRWALDQGLLESRFLVMYGDAYLTASLSEVVRKFLECHAGAMMAVQKNTKKWGQSNLNYQKGQVVLYDKNPASTQEFLYLDYGVIALESQVVLELIPNDQNYDLANFFKNLSISGRLLGHEVFEPVFEVGSPEGLGRFERFLELKGAP